ncbi:MAG TPA: NAD(+) synthetase, partial [Candidatus Saccharicenans sp.]|nr:NAD(+) synthetase [Candidatus Saccharicenans sp.]
MMKINCQLVTRVLTSFIREESNKAGFERNIIGVSGGLDSTVCAYLAVRAVGPQNIFGLIMPFKDYDQEG